MSKPTQINKRLVAKIPTPGNDTTYLGTNSVGTTNLQDASVTSSKLDPAVLNSFLMEHAVYNLGLAISVGASALTVALKQANGSDPSIGINSVKAAMRSPTLTSGVYNQRQVTSPLSLVISSGSTLGQTSASIARVFIYLIDNLGTLELAVSQKLFSETQLISTTAEGGAGAADSATVMYSTTARTSVPFRLIGFLDNTQTTAGTWASAGTKLQVGDYAALISETVYFYAHTCSTAASPTQPFIFSSVTSNSHGAYDSSTGRFKAPIAGFYSFRVLTYTGATLAEPEFWVNGTQITRSAGQASAGTPASGTFHYYLNCGDLVDIRATATASGNGTLNNFSGFLVK